MNTQLAQVEILMNQHRFDLAERELRHALGEEPQNGYAHALLACCLAELNRLNDAETAARQAVGLTPDDAYCHHAHGFVALRQEKYDTAERALREATRLEPVNASYHAVLAQTHLAQRRWRDALDVAERGLQFDGEHLGCMNARALALTKLGRSADAARTIEDALARDPEDAFTHANRGYAYLHQRRPNDALTHFREALRLDPNSDFARSGMVEALKSRYMVYRWLLAYFLWSDSLSRRAQWFLIIGLWAGAQVARNVRDQHPALSAVVGVLLGLYLAFVVLTWLGATFFDATLLINRFGRYALFPEARVAAIALIALILLAAGAMTYYWASKDLMGEIAALGCLFVALPVCSALRTRHPAARWKLLLLAGGIVVLGIVSFWALAVGTRNASTLGTVFLVSCFLYSWAANFIVMNAARGRG